MLLYLDLEKIEFSRVYIFLEEAMAFKEAIYKVLEFTNKDVLDKIVEKDHIGVMELLMGTPDFAEAFANDDEILNPLIHKVKSYGMTALLLRNGLNLLKTRYIEDDKIKTWCITFMLEDTLKVKINPNAPTAYSSFKTPFWRNMVTNTTVKLGWLKVFANGHKNLTEPLDVDVVNIDGNTHLHVRRDLLPEIFELCPNINIKNNNGNNVIDNRKATGLSNDAIYGYIHSVIFNTSSKERIKELETLLSDTQAELIKTKEKLKNIESVLSSSS